MKENGNDGVPTTPRPPAPRPQAAPMSYRAWAGKNVESPNARKAFAVRFTDAQMTRIDAMARAQNVTRAEAVRRLIDVAFKAGGEVLPIG